MSNEVVTGGEFFLMNIKIIDLGSLFLHVCLIERSIPPFRSQYWHIPDMEYLSFDWDLNVNIVIPLKVPCVHCDNSLKNKHRVPMSKSIPSLSYQWKHIVRITESILSIPERQNSTDMKVSCLISQVISNIYKVYFCNYDSVFESILPWRWVSMKT